MTGHACEDYHDPDVFFSSSAARQAVALQLCASCSALSQCAATYRERPDEYAIAAGIVPPRLRVDNRRRCAAPGCRHLLRQRPTEGPARFAERRYCSKACAGASRAAMGRAA